MRGPLMRTSWYRRTRRTKPRRTLGLATVSCWSVPCSLGRWFISCRGDPSDAAAAHGPRLRPKPLPVPASLWSADRPLLSIERLDDRVNGDGSMGQRQTDPGFSPFPTLLRRSRANPRAATDSISHGPACDTEYSTENWQRLTVWGAQKSRCRLLCNPEIPRRDSTVSVTQSGLNKRPTQPANLDTRPRMDGGMDRRRLARCRTGGGPALAGPGVEGPSQALRGSPCGAASAICSRLRAVWTRSRSG